MEHDAFNIEIAIDYAQLAYHNLLHSATELNSKNLTDEMKILHIKFGTKEVIRLANNIPKE